MKENLLKLNIQLLAEAAGDGTLVDTAAMEQLGENTKVIANAIMDSLTIIYNTVKDLHNNAGFDSEAGTALITGMDDIKGYLEKYQTSITNLGGFLINVAQAFLSADSQMNQEITAWGATVKGVVTQINEGVNSQAKQGSYDTSSYINDIKSSALNISGATRTIVGETAKMFGNTGTCIKSTTGKNLSEIGADVTNQAVGTIKTLFGYAGDNSSSTTISTIFNAFGNGLSELAGFLNS